MAVVIFKGVAIGGAFKDAFSKHIEDADVRHVFSLDFYHPIRRIRINGGNNTACFRNRGAVFNKFIEAIQSVRFVPAGVPIGIDASARNGKDGIAEKFKRQTAKIVAKNRRRGGQSDCSRKTGAISEGLVANKSDGFTYGQSATKAFAIDSTFQTRPKNLSYKRYPPCR